MATLSAPSDVFISHASAAYGVSAWPSRDTFNRSKCSGRPCCTNSSRNFTATRSRLETYTKPEPDLPGESFCIGAAAGCAGHRHEISERSDGSIGIQTHVRDVSTRVGEM